jgi:hypothetical protein
MEYKQHPRFDKYLIREDGLIISKKTGKELFKQKNNSGYWISHFYVNGKRTAGTIHRFIAETWVNNPENKPQVNHIDGNKENCHPNNLQWVTASENHKHAFLTGLTLKTREMAREIMRLIGRMNKK